jgi:hypothetical protein
LKNHFKFLFCIFIFSRAYAADLDQIRENLMIYDYPKHSAMGEIASEVNKLVTDARLEQSWSNSFVGIVNGSSRYGFAKRQVTVDDLRYIVPALAAIAIKNPLRDMWSDLHTENITTPAQQEHILNTYTIITLFQKLNAKGLLSDAGFVESAYMATLDTYLNETLSHIFFSKHEIHGFDISKEKISAFINTRIFPLALYLPMAEPHYQDIYDFHRSFNPQATYAQAQEFQHHDHHIMEPDTAIAVIQSALADIKDGYIEAGIEVGDEITQDEINQAFLIISNQNPDALKSWLEYQLIALPDHGTLETLYQRELAKEPLNGELLRLLDQSITAVQDRGVALHQPFIPPHNHGILPRHDGAKTAQILETRDLREGQDREYKQAIAEDREAEEKRKEEERNAALRRTALTQELEPLEEELGRLQSDDSSRISRGGNAQAAYEKREKIVELTTRVNSIRTELRLPPYIAPLVPKPQPGKLGSMPAANASARIEQSVPLAINGLSETLIDTFIDMVKAEKPNKEISASTKLTMAEITDLKILLNNHKKGKNPVQFTEKVIADLKIKLRSFRR